MGEGKCIMTGSETVFASHPSRMDMAAEHYPFCVVWCPIPLISWVLPFVGHVGICDSKGRIHDFEGSHCIGVDTMLFGNPVKYWDVSALCIPSMRLQNGEVALKEATDFDAVLNQVTTHFRKTQQYNFFTNNCHSFVASVLQGNRAVPGRAWNMFWVMWGVLAHGRYVSLGRLLRAHLPFAIIITLLVLCTMFLKNTQQA
ncbi:hypothetical protein TRVL_03204 [Trypanosoma vivax]|uniref:Uncharacterized protein n=1 Tax=Trypanosoma vivax (strain Y486) TaxID=1055687 RepID=G0U685_TRYVY|nr:hypothetical protein TRVL_03204 [Trypanosoma vivax]CCC51388.1 conserved hypothetical protein [Trypanosoma vivax Y486]